MIGVVGAGTMGAGIAQVAATAGEQVKVYDVAPGTAARAVEQTATRLERQVAKGRLDRQQAAEVIGRLSAADALPDLAEGDLVVEAVAERLAVKHALFAELEHVCGDDTILATNTSTISVTDIAARLDHPERVCGMHFFNPAPLMQLVEVPVGEVTGEPVAEAVLSRATAWGKTAVRCRSTPGFIVNRVARPFYGEAQRIVEEGTATVPVVDGAIRAAGFRMGPFELTDLIGNDVNLASTVSVYEQTGRDPRYAPTASQQELVDTGDLGRKTGRGWYDHADGEAPEPASPSQDAAAAIQLRILSML
ncbi:MAG: 3-hydroxyacyl-CoA dehydrogenase NAD-binding domain-containing protein, partial [Nocardioidaceae bacterium]